MVVCQSIEILNVEPLSGASPLPNFDFVQAAGYFFCFGMRTNCVSE
jgi:hypothetical protein